MKDNRKEIKNLVDETIEDIDTELGIENSEKEVISEENVKLLVNNLESNISYHDKIVDEEINRKSKENIDNFNIISKLFKDNYNAYKSFTLLTLEVFNKDLVNNENDFPKFILDIHQNIVNCCNNFMKYITFMSPSNISILNYLYNSIISSEYFTLDKKVKENMINTIKELLKERNNEISIYGDSIPTISLDELLFIILTSSNQNVNSLFLGLMDSCCNDLCSILSPIKESKYKLYISLDSKEEDMTNTDFTVGLFKYDEDEEYTEDNMVFKVTNKNMVYTSTLALLFMLSVESDIRKKYECLRKLDENGKPIEDEETLYKVQIDEFKDLDNLKSILININEFLSFDIQK